MKLNALMQMNCKPCLLVILTGFTLSNAYSLDLEAEKERIRHEVLAANPDQAIVNDLIEIRFIREVLNNLSPDQRILIADNSQFVLTNQEVTVTQTTDTTHTEIIKQTENIESKTNVQPTNDGFYAAIGNRGFLGYKKKYSNNFSIKAEFSGINNTNNSKTLDGSNYQLTQNDQSLAFYADWHPTGGAIHLSAGVSFNDMTTNLVGAPNSIVNINGHQVNLGSDVYSIQYTFPKVTPYIGIGYGNINSDDKKLSFYGDIGMLLGKYNAVATTSLTNSQGISSADIESEMNAVRDNLYKWALIPLAKFGLIYRFN